MQHLENEHLLLAIEAHLGETPTSQVDTFGMLNIKVNRLQIVPIVKFLKENQGFNFLTDLCGSHYPERLDAEFEVVYHLHNFIANKRLRVKVALSENDIFIPTLTGVFVGANWMERETFDFYGVQFQDHPDLRRILNMEDMDYHPLRKQYALEDETRTDKDDKFFGR